MRLAEYVIRRVADPVRVELQKFVIRRARMSPSAINNEPATLLKNSVFQPVDCASPALPTQYDWLNERRKFFKRTNLKPFQKWPLTFLCNYIINFFQHVLYCSCNFFEKSSYKFI